MMRPFMSPRYLISRGYGQPQDKDSGGSDDDMSDDGGDDTLQGTLRERVDGPGHRLEFLIGDHVLPYDMTVYQVPSYYYLFMSGRTLTHLTNGFLSE